MPTKHEKDDPEDANPSHNGLSGSEAAGGGIVFRVGDIDGVVVDVFMPSGLGVAPAVAARSRALREGLTAVWARYHEGDSFHEADGEAESTSFLGFSEFCQDCCHVLRRRGVSSGLRLPPRPRDPRVQPETTA